MVEINTRLLTDIRGRVSKISALTSRLLMQLKSTDNRFRCMRCGNCCRWAGYVRISGQEVEEIASYLGYTVEAFVAAFTRLTVDRRGLSLTEKPDGSCCFLDDDNHCRIQAVKPQQCRDFPNRWNFEGFERECCAIDTWDEDAP